MEYYSVGSGRLKREAKEQGPLLAAIAVIIILAAVAYALYGGGRAAAGGAAPPAGPGPCASPRMPALAPGLACQAGSNGLYAWLSTQTPAATGVAPPPGAVLQTYTATDDVCVSESACQAYCSGDPACNFYTYDSGAQTGSAHCLATGSICKTHAGPLPAAVGASARPYVTGGIPAALL